MSTFHINATEVKIEDQAGARGSLTFLPPLSEQLSILTAPNQNGVIVLSINNVFADTSGNVNIAGGGGLNISLTTVGTSGAATLNTGTGVLNIPNYTVGGGGTTSSYIEVVIGTADAIALNLVDGATVYTNANIANRQVEVERELQSIPSLPWNANTYFTKVLANNFLTLSDPLIDGQIIKIKIV